MNRIRRTTISRSAAGLFLLLFTLTATVAQAASVTVEACAEVAVTSHSGDTPPPLAFPERCLNVELAVDGKAGDGFGLDRDTALRDVSWAYGGCNSSGGSIDYTLENRYRYAIVTNADHDEHTAVEVEISLADEAFTSGADTVVTTGEGSFPDALCVDGFIRIRIAAEAASGIDPTVLANPVALSGFFYDPENPGHGFDVKRVERGVVIYYYGHTADGERLWLVSDVYEEPVWFQTPFGMTFYEVRDGNFGTPVAEVTPWGELTVVFDDCDRGTAWLDGSDGELQMPLVRLAGLPGMGCDR